MCYFLFLLTKYNPTPASNVSTTNNIILLSVAVFGTAYTTQSGHGFFGCGCGFGGWIYVFVIT